MEQIEFSYTLDELSIVRCWRDYFLDYVIEEFGLNVLGVHHRGRSPQRIILVATTYLVADLWLARLVKVLRTLGAHYTYRSGYVSVRDEVEFFITSNNNPNSHKGRCVDMVLIDKAIDRHEALPLLLSCLW